MAPGFALWRRNVEFVECAETLIAPLLDELTFTTDKDIGTTFSSWFVSDSADGLRAHQVLDGR